MTLELSHSVDARGLACPMPIIKAAQAVRGMAPGDLVEVLATDPGSRADFAAWSRTTGNELIDTSEQDGVFRFVLRRK